MNCRSLKWENWSSIRILRWSNKRLGVKVLAKYSGEYRGVESEIESYVVSYKNGLYKVSECFGTMVRFWPDVERAIKFLKETCYD